MPVACGPDHCGVVSGEKKRWIAELNLACVPIVYAYGAVCKPSKLSRMLAYSAGAPHTGAVEGQCVVYARWNMENDVAYVGETEKFATRVGQHYMKTLAHGKGRKCTGCSEQHAKYLKHRPVAAALWLMTPVRICASKTEARLLERKILSGLLTQSLTGWLGNIHRNIITSC